MKKAGWATIVALALTASAVHAGEITVSGGAFGGMSFPVLQDDQGNGSIFGVRVPVKVLSMLTVEPFYSSSALGDKTLEVAPGFSTTRSGSDVTSFGVNAVIPFGLTTMFYPYVGIGSTNYKRDGQDETFTSYNLGLGFGFTVMPKLTLDVRGELQAASTGDTSRKVGNVMVGASYSIFSTP
jgi:opacity protein-like surface antigen